MIYQVALAHERGAMTMTTRYKAVLVTLDHDMRDDDAESVLTALRMVKGVIDVAPVPANPDDYTIRMRLFTEFRQALVDALNQLRHV